MGSGDPRGERGDLEEARERDPDDVDVRVSLGRIYYQVARDALDLERDESRYLDFAERALDEFLTAVELDPSDPDPHFWLGVMDTYRGKGWKALGGFRNAHRLASFGHSYSNIAELYIYLGHLHKARRWNGDAWRNGATGGAVLLNDMLLAWREDDLATARDRFADLRRSHPEALHTINMWRVPDPPERFEEFAAYCCGSPACGPYLEKECRALDLEVKHHDASQEAILQELRLEIERTRRLRGVYDQRKELEIEVEIDDEPEAAE